MAFLNFAKKKEKIPDTTDLDIPPEPPKIVEEEISTKEPMDEELMPFKPKTKAKERLPEIPPLPSIEELEPLPESEEELAAEELKELELPPPPVKKKRRFFFRKPKKVAEKLPLPSIEEELPPLPPLPEEEKELPPLPEIEEEIPPMPPLPKEEEFPEIPPVPETEEEIPAMPPLPEKVPTLPELEREIHFTPLKPTPPPERPVREPLRPKEPLPEEGISIRKKFITIDDFKQIQNNITNTKSTLKDIHFYLSELEEHKKMDRKYLELNNSLQDIQKKLVFVDKTLFKEVA